MNWPAWGCLGLGIGCALVSIRIGQDSVERYGRRIPVTEMLALGWRGDRRLFLGGLAGWAMAVCLAAAGVFAIL